MKLDLSFIGRNIRKLRRQHNWSMAKLAARVGMNEVPLGRIERGLNAPSASVIYRLSKELGVSIDTLFAEKKEEFRSLKHESPIKIIDSALSGLPMHDGTVEDARNSIMGFEGTASRAYFQCLSKVHAGKIYI